MIIITKTPRHSAGVFYSHLGVGGDYENSLMNQIDRIGVEKCVGVVFFGIVLFHYIVH